MTEPRRPFAMTFYSTDDEGNPLAVKRNVTVRDCLPVQPRGTPDRLPCDKCGRTYPLDSMTLNHTNGVVSERFCKWCAETRLVPVQELNMVIPPKPVPKSMDKVEVDSEAEAFARLTANFDVDETEEVRRQGQRLAVNVDTIQTKFCAYRGCDLHMPGFYPREFVPRVVRDTKIEAAMARTQRYCSKLCRMRAGYERRYGKPYPTTIPDDVKTGTPEYDRLMVEVLTVEHERGNDDE